MAPDSSPNMCECDCGDPNAGRCRLTEVPPGEEWPLCVCPYCGPEPAAQGGRRQCTTQVHPIVMVLPPGDLLLCEDCRSSCFRRLREARLRKRGRDESKPTDHTESVEDQDREEKRESGTEQHQGASDDAHAACRGGHFLGRTEHQGRRRD